MLQENFHTDYSFDFNRMVAPLIKVSYYEPGSWFKGTLQSRPGLRNQPTIRLRLGQCSCSIIRGQNFIFTSSSTYGGKKSEKHLKIQSCKLYNNKYMIASAQITNSEIFAFIAVLVFKLLSRKVLFKRQQKQLKSRLLFKKITNFTGKLLQNYK